MDSSRGVRTNCQIQLDWITHEGKKVDAGGRRVQGLLNDVSGLQYGDRLKITGSLVRLHGPRNPGEFDFPAWLALNGIHAGLESETVEVLAHDEGNRVLTAALGSRGWIQKTITEDLRLQNPETAGVISAMVLGERGDAPDELLRNFRFSGTLHIFAVSGLHVGMIALILNEIFKMLRIRRRPTAVLIIAVLIVYAFVTGLRPSAVRATVMTAVFLFGRAIDRPARLPNSLGAAALIILAVDPFQALMPGFQLSFAVLATIAALCHRFERRFAPLVTADPFLPKALIPPRQMRAYEFGQTFVAYLSLSLSAWIGSTLLIALYFHLLTPIAIFANIVIVPVAFAVIFTAVSSVLFYVVSLSGISVLLNNANHFLILVISGMIAFAASIPGGHFFVTKPGFLRAHCEIGIFDFPRGGGGAHIHTSTAGRWQIDAGPFRSYKRILEPFYQTKGLNHLDGLVLTHADADHTGAAPEVERDYHPALTSANVPDKRSPSLNALQVDQPLVKGDTFQIDKRTTLRVLFPPAGHEAPLADDRSAVLQLECDGWRVLFMSDAGHATERWLMGNLPTEELRSDVIVRGNHTSSPSGDLGFVERIRPKVIIATNSEYPDNEKLPLPWKKRIRAMGITLFDQEESGHVSVAIHDDTLTLTGFVSGEVHKITRD